MAINELCCAGRVKWDVVQLPLVVYLWGPEEDIKLKPQSRNICLFISPWVTIYRGSFCSIFLMNLKQRIDAEYIFCMFIKKFYVSTLCKESSWFIFHVLQCFSCVCVTTNLFCFRYYLQLIDQTLTAAPGLHRAGELSQIGNEFLMNTHETYTLIEFHCST